MGYIICGGLLGPKLQQDTKRKSTLISTQMVCIALFLFMLVSLVLERVNCCLFWRTYVSSHVIISSSVNLWSIRWLEKTVNAYLKHISQSHCGSNWVDYGETQSWNHQLSYVKLHVITLDLLILLLWRHFSSRNIMFSKFDLMSDIWAILAWPTIKCQTSIQQKAALSVHLLVF